MDSTIHSICPFRSALLAPLVSLILAIPTHAAAAENPAPSTVEETHSPAVFEEGAHCLFIGHSFFIPVAKAFDEIAGQNDYPSHQMEFVFSGGASGAPGRLWNNPKRKSEIERILSTGEIDLLGMTVAWTDSKLEDYRRWIELARNSNPKTRFFIGQCWTTGGQRQDADEFDQAVEQAGDRLFKIVRELRKAYPDTSIIYANYGKTASLLKSDFDASELEDLNQLIGRNNQSLFRDQRLGHGGPMILQLSALSWLSIIYGADIDQIRPLSYNPSDVNRVVSEVVEFNQRYQEAASATSDG